MVGRALSEQAKKAQKRQIVNDKLAAALDAYQQEKVKGTGPRSGLRKVAAKYGVNFMTLSRHACGGITMSKFNMMKQKLTPMEESIIVSYTLGEADRGFPPTYKATEKQANAIIESRDGPEYQPVGTSWVDRFLQRHRDELQTHWSKPLDTARARGLNPTVVRHWYSEVVAKHYLERGIGPQDTFGMDEAGFPQEAGQRQRVIGRRGTKTQHKQGTANRENVTALVTICTDGTTLRPTIIFKGKNFMKNWRDNNIAKASFVYLCHM
jgi:hypothetical protein